MDLIHRLSSWYRGTEHENLWQLKDFAIKNPAVSCLVEPALEISLSSLLVWVRCQTWLQLFFGDSICQKCMTHRVSSHLAKIFLSSSDLMNIKLQVCLLFSWFIYFTEGIFSCLMIKWFFQAYHLQYSALFIEICHFSGTTLLSLSWRISPCVCQLRRGEKDLAELLPFWVLSPKRRDSTM